MAFSKESKISCTRSELRADNPGDADPLDDLSAAAVIGPELTVLRLEWRKTHVDDGRFPGDHFDIGDEGSVSVLPNLEQINPWAQLDHQSVGSGWTSPRLAVDQHLGVERPNA